MIFLFYFADLIVCAIFATRANVGITFPIQAMPDMPAENISNTY
jgi:hypothetical protein